MSSRNGTQPNRSTRSNRSTDDQQVRMVVNSDNNDDDSNFNPRRSLVDAFQNISATQGSGSLRRPSSLPRSRQPPANENEVIGVFPSRPRASSQTESPMRRASLPRSQSSSLGRSSSPNVGRPVSLRRASSSRLAEVAPLSNDAGEVIVSSNPSPLRRGSSLRREPSQNQNVVLTGTLPPSRNPSATRNRSLSRSSLPSFGEAEEGFNDEDEDEGNWGNFEDENPEAALPEDFTLENRRGDFTKADMEAAEAKKAQEAAAFFKRRAEEQKVKDRQAEREARIKARKEKRDEAKTKEEVEKVAREMEAQFREEDLELERVLEASRRQLESDAKRQREELKKRQEIERELKLQQDLEYAAVEADEKEKAEEEELTRALALSLELEKQKADLEAENERLRVALEEARGSEEKEFREMPTLLYDISQSSPSNLFVVKFRSFKPLLPHTYDRNEPVSNVINQLKYELNLNDEDELELIIPPNIPVASGEGRNLANTLERSGITVNVKVTYATEE